MLVGKGEHPVGQVAPGGQQLVVVAADELPPGKVGVASFRHRCGDVVADGVGVVAVENIRQPDSPVAALAELCPLDVHALVGRHVVGEVQPFLGILLVEAFDAHQLGLPDHGMEGDVVLADEDIAAGVGIVPPVLPGLRLPGVLRPFNGGGEIAHHRLEPDVEPLVFPALEGHGDPPLDVSGHRTAFQASGDIVAGKVDDIRSPEVGFRVEVGEQPVGEGRQVQEEVLGLPEHRPAAVCLAARIDQFGGVEQVAAVVALVAARLAVAADRAGALHIAVRQEAVLAFREQLDLLLSVQVFLFIESREDILGNAVVVLRVGVGEQVVGDADPLLGFEEAAVVMLEELARRRAALVGFDGDRRPVGIRSGDHQHAVPLEPVVAGEDVRRQVGAGEVPDVQVAVRVGPGDRDMDQLGHSVLLTRIAGLASIMDRY